MYRTARRQSEADAAPRSANITKKTKVLFLGGLQRRLASTSSLPCTSAHAAPCLLPSIAMPPQRSAVLLFPRQTPTRPLVERAESHTGVVLGVVVMHIYIPRPRRFSAFSLRRSPGAGLPRANNRYGRVSVTAGGNCQRTTGS